MSFYFSIPQWHNNCMENIFGERLKISRKKKLLTASELAGIMSVGQNTVSRWETGTRAPDFETVRTLARLLDTSVGYLMGEVDDPAPPTEWGKYKVEQIEAETTARPDYAKSSGQIIRVPVYGPELAACCGNGFGCMEQVTAEPGGFVDMPAGFVGPYDRERPPFIIYADGDSMIDAGIADGSQVIINPADAVLDGDAALVDFAMTPVAHSIAIKRVYYLDAGAVEIRSACGDGWKRTFTRADRDEKSLRIIGKVEWIGHKPKRG